MTKQNHKTGFLVAAMVFSAIALRVLGKFDILKVPGGILRSLIYIALYIGWGISVSKRIIQVQVRHYLISVSGLMVFWFVIRSMRYYFITDIGIARQLWYLYYLPMLFIPLFSLFVAISLGKPANARLSKTALRFSTALRSRACPVRTQGCRKRRCCYYLFPRFFVCCWCLQMISISLSFPSPKERYGRTQTMDIHSDIISYSGGRSFAL